MSSTKFALKGVLAPANGVAKEGMVIVKVGVKSLMVTKEHFEEYKAQLPSSKLNGPESNNKNQAPTPVQKTPQAPNQEENNSMFSNAKGFGGQVMQKAAVSVMASAVAYKVMDTYRSQGILYIICNNLSSALVEERLTI